MASENETIEDIVAMLRRFAKGEELPTDEIPSFTSLSDRIASAWRREKETLASSDWERCAACQTNMTGEGYGEIPPPIGEDDVCDSCEVAKRLREGKPWPMRNCDRFADGDDAFYAFDGECKRKRIRPCRAGRGFCSAHDSIHCFKDWLFSKCESKETDNE